MHQRSTVAASCAMAAALLAGCSTSSQGIGALPNPSGMTSTAESVTRLIPSGKMTISKLLELQAQGKLPAPVPPKVLQWQLKRMQGRVRPLVMAKKCTTAVWATASGVGYLLGMDSSLENVCKSVDVEKLGAYDPEAVKVDGSRNVWVASEYNSADDGGVVEEFGPKGNLQANYSWSHCLDGYTDCYGYGYDAAENSKNVFAAVADWYSQTASQTDQGSGFEVFGNGDPSSSPTYVTVSDQTSGTYCAPICSVGYTDIDSAGNLWFDFYGDGAGSCSGGGLGEVTNPTTSPTVSVIFPACTYEYPGGVYVSNGGKVLNVTDQDSRKTYQYHLPVTSTSQPFNTLGPTAANGEGLGNPVAGGFNASETEFALGDGYGWFDVGTLPSNKWKDVATNDCPPEFAYGCAGMAFTPSDK
jgi:hypothetical protein